MPEKGALVWLSWQGGRGTDIFSLSKEGLLKGGGIFKVVDTLEQTFFLVPLTHVLVRLTVCNNENQKWRNLYSFLYLLHQIKTTTFNCNEQLLLIKSSTAIVGKQFNFINTTEYKARSNRYRLVLLLNMNQQKFGTMLT